MKKKLMLLILLVLSFCIGCNTNDKNECIDETPTDKETIQVQVVENKEYSSITEVIENVKPSVVDIYSYSTSFSSAGSGVIIGKSNNAYYIVTNHHVIDGATSFEIVTYNKQGVTTTYTSELVGTSLKNDIAVLEIETTNELTVAQLISNSDEVKIGTEVIAIGNPLGILGGSVTHGIISATEREVYISDLGYMSLFQTDAAINSGNSGGALFNYDGLLIGIVNSGYTSYEGLNFAIPANIALSCFESIIKTRTETNFGYMIGDADLGMNLLESTIYSDSSLKSQINIIYVSSVEQNSDASKYQIYDYESFSKGKTETFYVLSKINGEEVKSLTDANKALDDVVSGVEITFEFIEIAYTRTSGFFGQSAIYLTDNIKEIKIVPTQYIYVIS